MAKQVQNKNAVHMYEHIKLKMMIFQYDVTVLFVSEICSLNILIRRAALLRN